MHQQPAGSTKPISTGSAQASAASTPVDAAKRLLGQVAVVSGGVMEAAARPKRALDGSSAKTKSEHDAGDLRRAGEAVAVEPGVVDGDGERAHAEELDRADVVQRLHQRERHACGKRGPRQRQRHLPERRRRAPAERAAHLEHADRLREEARPRGDVDVRVEHHAHHEDGAADAPDVGEPVVLARCASRTPGASSVCSEPE